MCNEWARRSTARDTLQRRCFNLGVACLVEKLTHRANYLCAFQERFLNAFVHNEVYIALTETQFGVVELVVSHSVLILHNGKRLDALAQQREFFGMNRYFARLCAEYETAYAYKVADVEQTFKHRVVQFLVLIGTDVVASNIHLNTAFGILQLHKAGFSHHTARHHPAGNAHFALLVVLKVISYVG